MASETSTSASLNTFPVLADAAPIRSPRALRSSMATLESLRWRSSMERVRQPSGSALAVATAASISSVVARRNRATVTFAGSWEGSTQAGLAILHNLLSGNHQGNLDGLLRGRFFPFRTDGLGPLPIGCQGPVRIGFIVEFTFVIGAHFFREALRHAVLDPIGPVAGFISIGAGCFELPFEKVPLRRTDFQIRAHSVNSFLRPCFRPGAAPDRRWH
jgi:hypothetical protein